jgi:hypothetical protein
MHTHTQEKQTLSSSTFSCQIKNATAKKVKDDTMGFGFRTARLKPASSPEFRFSFGLFFGCGACGLFSL